MKAHENRLFGALVVTLAAFWATVAVYAVHASMPFNPVRLPYAHALDIRAVLPQGWNFFTRDAREPDLLFFGRTPAGEWRSLSIGPNSNAATWFGARRTARAQGIESGLLVSHLSGAPWSGCATEPTACLERTKLAAEVTNISPDPTLCGDVGFARQEPLPWAWSGSKTIMPSKVMRVRIKC